jgi:ATP/maltotriose-dependent transcriptional regulator MalT
VQAQENNYRTFLAPLDMLMVTARCLLEASKLDEAVQTCKLIMDLAREMEIWPWYFMAEGTIIRIQISQGQLSQASDAISRQRKALKSFSLRNELSWLVDMSEIYLKATLKDDSRVEQLANRMPDIELVRQIQLGYKFKRDPKKTSILISSMPEVTAREKIQKWLSEASANSGHEKLALDPLAKALDLGADCGYHEYFLRQIPLYPLIIKAATNKPTIYLENLAKEMSDRINVITHSSGEMGEKLTNRELEILKHLNSGNAISSIAKSLHISQNTMKTHLRNTYRKLNADGRHSAVDKAKKLLLI